MKLMLFTLMFLFSFSLFSDDLITCKMISDDDSDNGDKYKVEVVLKNPFPDKKQAKCPLVIKTRNKIASQYDDHYLNLWKVNETGLFPCKYFGKEIELKCKR